MTSNSNTLRSLRCTLATKLGKGYLSNDYKTQWRIRGATEKWLDKYFFLILQKLEVKNFLECGAHEASASEYFLFNGEEAIAVEANPITYRKKTLKVAQPSLKVYNYGVGESNSELGFNIPRNNELAGNATFKPKENVNYNKINISVKTIDELNSRFKLKQNLAIWIDVEGMALEALKGGHNTLLSDECLVLKIEVETHAYFKDQFLSDEVDNYLVNLGYSAILVDFSGPKQFNVVYVKKNQLNTIDYLLIEAYADFPHSSFIDGFPKIRLSKLKHVFLSVDNRNIKYFVHFIAAALGSQSSKTFIKNNNRN